MRARRLLVVVLWVGGTLALATHLGSSDVTESFAYPVLRWLGVEEGWAHRAHKLLRKGGHVLGYAGFALLLWWALGGVRHRARWALGVALVLAVTDEAVQSLFPERGAQVTDVLIDVAAAGAALWLAEAWSRRRAAAAASAPKRPEES